MTTDSSKYPFNIHSVTVPTDVYTITHDTAKPTKDDAEVQPTAAGRRRTMVKQLKSLLGAKILLQERVELSTLVKKIVTHKHEALTN